MNSKAIFSVILVVAIGWVTTLYMQINTLTAALGVAQQRSVQDEVALVSCLKK